MNVTMTQDQASGSVFGRLSASAVTMDTLTWTSPESSPAIRMNTKPYVSLKLILR